MKLWKFCSGYVNIVIMGKYPERLVNRCIAGSVPLSNCERRSDGISADVSMADMKRLRRIASGCGCRVRIRSKHGAPLIFRLLRENAVFAAALILFFTAAAAASARIWFIRAETSGIPPEDVYRMLDDMGVRRGVSRGSVRSRDVAALIGLDPRIVSAKVTVKGVVLNVAVSEMKSASLDEPEPDPANVYADRDCVITYITVSEGRPEVRAGQAVKKGDLLIRGDLSAEKEGYRVHAAGTVYGETVHIAEAVAAPYRESLVISGNTAPEVRIEVFGKELRSRPPFSDSESELMKKSVFTCCPLPVSINLYECRELKPGTVIDSPEGTAERAAIEAQAKLMDTIPNDARIISVTTRCETRDDGSVRAVATAVTSEKIGVTRSF